MDTAKLNKSSSRRSSILKPPKARHPLQNLNFNSSSNESSPTTTTKLKRRVSFAEKKHIKEFCNSLEQGTVWDNTYEEHDLSNNKIPCASNQGECSTENIHKENLQVNEFLELPNLIHSEISPSISHECDILGSNIQCVSDDKDQEDKNVENYDLDITNPVESIGYTCIEKNQEEISVNSSNVLQDPRIQENEYSFSSKKIVVFQDEDENVAVTSGQHSLPDVNNFNYNAFNETWVQDDPMEFTGVICNSLQPSKISIYDENAVYNDPSISQSLANMEFKEINGLQKSNSSITKTNEDIIQDISMEFTKAISSIIKADHNSADSAAVNCLNTKDDKTTIFNNASMEITAAVPLITNRSSDTGKLQQMQSGIIDKYNCNFTGMSCMASDTIIHYDDEPMEMTIAVETNIDVVDPEDNHYQDKILNRTTARQTKMQGGDEFTSTEERTKLLDVSMEMTKAVKTNFDVVHKEDNHYPDNILYSTTARQSKMQGRDEFTSTEERTKFLDVSMEMTKAVRTNFDIVHQEDYHYPDNILYSTTARQPKIQDRDEFASTEERTKFLDVSMEMTKAVKTNFDVVHQEDNRSQDKILDRTRPIQSKIQDRGEAACIEERTKFLDTSMEMTKAVRTNFDVVDQEDNHYPDNILYSTTARQSKIQGRDEFTSTEERTKFLDVSMEMTKAVKTNFDVVHQEDNRYQDKILDRTRPIQSKIQDRGEAACIEERTKFLDTSMEMTKAVKTNFDVIHQEYNRYQDKILDRTRPIQSKIQDRGEAACIEERTKFLDTSMEMTKAVRTNFDVVDQEDNHCRDKSLNRTAAIQFNIQGRDEFISTEERTKLLDVSMEMTKAVRTNFDVVHQKDNHYPDNILYSATARKSKIQGRDEFASTEERTKFLDISMEMTKAVKTNFDVVHQEDNRYQDKILDRTRPIQSKIQDRDEFASTEERTKFLDISMEMTKAVKTNFDVVHQEDNRYQDKILDRTRPIQSKIQDTDEFASTEERSKVLDVSMEMTKACFDVCSAEAGKKLDEEDCRNVNDYLRYCKDTVNSDNSEVYTDKPMDLSAGLPFLMHHSVKDRSNLSAQNTTSREQDSDNIELNNCRNSNVTNMKILHCTANESGNMLISNTSMINAEDSYKRRTITCVSSETQQELNNKALLLPDMSIENIGSMQGSSDCPAVFKPETDSSNVRQSKLPKTFEEEIITTVPHTSRNLYSMSNIDACGSERNSIIKEQFLNNTQTSSNCKAGIPLHETVEQNINASASNAINERETCLTIITETASCTAISAHTNTSADDIPSTVTSDMNQAEHRSQHEHLQNNSSFMKTFAEHLTDDTVATKKPDVTSASTENSTPLTNAVKEIKTSILREEDYGHCISKSGTLDITNSNEEHLQDMSSTYHNEAGEELESIKPPSFINFDESEVCAEEFANSIISNQDLQKGIDEVSLTELKESSRNSSKIIEKSSRITKSPVCKSIQNTTCNHPNPNLIHEHQALKEDVTSKWETFGKCNIQDVVNNFTTDCEDQVYLSDAQESEVSDMDDRNMENQELECSSSEDNMTEPILQHSLDSPNIIDRNTHSVSIKDKNPQYLLTKSDISKRTLSNTAGDSFRNIEAIGHVNETCSDDNMKFHNARNALNEIAANSETLDRNQIVSDIKLRENFECTEKLKEKDSSIGQSTFTSLIDELKTQVQSDDIIWDIYYKNVERKIIAICYMSSSLLLIMFLTDDSDSDSNQFVKKIKLISRLTDDADTLIHIVHRLILEKIDSEKLTQLCTNYNDILPMLNYISDEVKLSMDFMFDLKRLDDLHLMEIFRDRISFIMRTQRMNIVLKITINIKPFNQIKEHDIHIDSLIGSAREEDVKNLITNIKRDHKFLRRYMSDVRDYIYLMEESSSPT